MKCNWSAWLADLARRSMFTHNGYTGARAASNAHFRNSRTHLLFGEGKLESRHLAAHSFSGLRFDVVSGG